MDVKYLLYYRFLKLQRMEFTYKSAIKLIPPA